MDEKDLDSGFDDRKRDVSSSEKFMALVGATVDFGSELLANEAVREQIVRFTVLGSPERAVELIQTTTGMSEGAARALVENVGLAADRAFYATGLRP